MSRPVVVDLGVDHPKVGSLITERTNACPIVGTWWAFLEFLGVAARFHLPWAQPTKHPPSTARDAAEILHLNVDQ